MPGSATLGTNLVDSLVPDVIDELRGSLHPELGVRQFRVFVVTRTWSGEAIGEGTASDAELEIDPQPMVKPYVGVAFSRTLMLGLEPCGLDESGSVELSEVSLTYTETELGGPPADPMRQELLYRIDDAHGQGVASRFFIPSAVPYPDREQDMGWRLLLRLVGG